jgi:ferredoxin--NADP+ reductase
VIAMQGKTAGQRLVAFRCSGNRWDGIAIALQNAVLKSELKPKVAMVPAADSVAFWPDDVRRARQNQYNATVESVHRVHSDLRIIRVVPDGGVPSFEPGQYITLGVGNWEARIPGVDMEQLDVVHENRLAKRAYSISCSIFTEGGQLRRPKEFPYLEFYVALVRHGVRRAPALTPRLFALNAGSRLFMNSRAAGQYTLAPVGPGDDVFFFATGTGEAPHNAMITELLCRQHRGRIVNAVSVRYRHDAAYRECHAELMRRFANYFFCLLTTREPNSTGSQGSSSRGAHRLQELVQTGSLERESGVLLDPSRSHVFLCGNPDMIGARHRASAEATRWMPGSMLDILARRGLRPDSPHGHGRVHFERYW